VPINKTTFYIGETIKIYGTISPVPQNNNIQLASWYYCPASKDYWRADDLWTTCNSSGYFEFNFPARIGEPSSGYCKVTTSQNWMATVRYQRVIGEPPDSFESLNWTVINQQYTKKASRLELRATDVNGYDITSGPEPLDIVLRGRLTDAVTGSGLTNRRVYIYENGTQIGYATTDAAGAFVMTVTRNRGTYTYYAEWAGDDQYEGC
jgi:hypothetical protein